MTLIRQALVMLAILAVVVLSVIAQSSRTQTPEELWPAQLEQIRQVARMIPGRRAVRINVLKFAESHRSKKFSVQGAPDEPSIQARTVFQIVFADGTVMIDSGMDEQVHRFFGRGTIEPYYADARTISPRSRPKRCLHAPKSKVSRQIRKCRRSK
jgi:hypothetical protein